MNPQTAHLSEKQAARYRAYLEAARVLQIDIGDKDPEQAIEHIINTGNGARVSELARRLYPEAFN